MFYYLEFAYLYGKEKKEHGEGEKGGKGHLRGEGTFFPLHSV